MIDLELNKELNLMASNNFHFEAFELPKVSLFTQNFTMPGVNLGRAEVATSNVDYDVPGDKIVFEDLNISFLIDEYMENYIEIFNWMSYLGFPESTEQFKQLSNNNSKYTETSDMLLSITSNKLNSIIKINFVDCFPTDLSAISMTTTDPTITPIVCDVTFDYSYYYFEPME